MLSTDKIRLNEVNKQLVWDHWRRLDQAGPGGALSEVAAVMASDAAWHGHAPVGSLVGPEAFAESFWLPLLEAVPDLKRQTHLFFGGCSNARADGDLSKDGRMWVTGTGYFNGTFSGDHLGIPASGEPVSIRWGDFSCIEDGRIVETYFLIDVVDLIRQAGRSVLPPSRGLDGLYPAPAAADGILLKQGQSGATTAAPPSWSAADSAYSLDHIRRFLFDGLNAYDESDLASMGMADYFESDVQWYGPGGIGACNGLAEFEDLHQQPWLVGFPDRQVQGLDALFAEGPFSGAPGWAGVEATHTGPYLDSPATGRTVVFNGLDWWKRDGEKYIENWVFVDMIHLFDQFGVDLLGRI